MKITFATHHFPPNYRAGAEQYAYRVTKELTNRGHDVEVICIESISEGGVDPRVKNDCYDGIQVIRLSIDLRQYEDPFTANYRNDHLGKWFFERLSQNRPDIFHVNAGYLLSGKVLEASHQLGIPTILTLHDYWYMCPRITLLRTNGDICQEPVPESRCTWCQLSDQRRYRFWDQITHNGAGEIISNLGKNPFYADLFGLTTSNKKIRDRRKYIQETLCNVDVVISPSKYLLGKFEQYNLDAKEKIYIPFGYDKQPEASSKTSSEAGLIKESQRKKIRIGYFGQISPHKGVHTLIRAFNASNEISEQAELCIFGNVDKEKEYGSLIRRLAKGRNSITFNGSYDHHMIGDIMDKIDVVVVPSEWYENRPTVIIEAFYYNKPVIAANIGGIPELVSHEKNGLLFKPGDEKGLTLLLKRIIHEPALLSTLRNGIDPVKTIDDEINELEALYRRNIKTPDMNRLGMESKIIKGGS